MSENEITSQMSTAYSVLPHVLMVSWHFLRNVKWYNLITPLLGIVLLLSLGNRGSIVCFFFFISVEIFFAQRGKNKFVLLLFFIVIGYLFYKYIYAISFFLNGILGDLGMSTRLVDLYLNDELMSDNSALERLSIKDKLWNAIENGGPFGYGIGGDQILTGGSYSHNLIIELMVSFGYLGGSLLLFWLLILCFTSLRKADSRISRSFWLLLFSTSVVQLMMSHTYLFCPEFFLFLGYCVSLKRGNQLPTPVWEDVKDE